MQKDMEKMRRELQEKENTIVKINDEIDLLKKTSMQEELKNLKQRLQEIKNELIKERM